MRLIAVISFLVLALRCDAFTPSSIGGGCVQTALSSSSFRRNFHVSASATIDNTPSSYEMSNFARRMKNIISKDKKKEPRERKSSKAPENLLRIETLEDFKKLLSNKQDKIVVVRWYAPWCKACKAVAPLFYRLAFTFPDAIFVDVPVTPENANLHQGLGVPSLPFGHIYHPTGKLVEELKISRKHFANFARVLKTHVDGQCDIEYGENGLICNPNSAASETKEHEALAKKS